MQSSKQWRYCMRKTVKLPKFGRLRRKQCVSPLRGAQGSKGTWLNQVFLDPCNLRRNWLEGFCAKFSKPKNVTKQTTVTRCKIFKAPQ